MSDLPILTGRGVDPLYASAAYNLALTRHLIEYVSRQLLAEGGGQATKVQSADLPYSEAQVPRDHVFQYQQYLLGQVVALEAFLRQYRIQKVNEPAQQPAQPVFTGREPTKRKRGRRGGKGRAPAPGSGTS